MDTITGRIAKCVFTLVVVLLTASSSMDAYTLGRGHQLLLYRGLQTQAMVCPSYMNNQFDLTRWAESGFTCANTDWHSYPQLLGDAPGIPWARIVNYYTGTLTGYEGMSVADTPYAPSMVSAQVNDEQDIRDPTTLSNTKTTLEYWRANHPDVIGYTNQPNTWLNGSLISVTDLLTYMAEAQPDMLCMDDYQFAGQNWQTDSGVSPGRRRSYYWYHQLEVYRQASIAGNDGTGVTPIPWGMYIQAFNFANGSPFDHVVSESEMRLQYFAPWTMGAKFLIAYVYNNKTGTNTAGILFDGDGDSTPTGVFYWAKECNRQSALLGRTLVELQNTGVYMERGYYMSDGSPVQSAKASNIPDFFSGCVPHLLDVTAANLGTGNDGLAGDVVLGKFKVLDESFDGPDYSGQTYFMVMNGLCTPTGSAYDTRQEITLTFDSGRDTLQRLNRDTGLVEDVPLVLQGDGTYRLDLVLDGGTADLFKFKTGAPFAMDSYTPVVDDTPRFRTDTSSLSAHWQYCPAAEDYQYCVGTTAGGSDVVGWTSNGTSTSLALSGLNLTLGATYYVSVKQTGYGITSPTGVSNGVTICNLYWSDGFESNNFTAGGWTNSGCTISTAYSYSGTHSALFNLSDTLTKSYSTSGKSNIVVQYMRFTRFCDADDHFVSEWSDGHSWTTLEDVAGNSDWALREFALPTGANNKSKFKIRFKTVNNDSTDYAYLDDVKILGL